MHTPLACIAYPAEHDRHPEQRRLLWGAGAGPGPCSVRHHHIPRVLGASVGHGRGVQGVCCACAVRVLCVCCACAVRVGRGRLCDPNVGASVAPVAGDVRVGGCAPPSLSLTHSLAHLTPTLPYPPTHPNTHALYQDTGLLAYFQEQLQWRKSTLQRIHLFDNLAEDTLEDLASSFRVCHADQGTILQVQGAVPQRVCILTKGVAKVGKCVCLGGVGGAVCCCPVWRSDPPPRTHPRHSPPPRHSLHELNHVSCTPNLLRTLHPHPTYFQAHCPHASRTHHVHSPRAPCPPTTHFSPTPPAGSPPSLAPLRPRALAQRLVALFCLCGCGAVGWGMGGGMGRC
jgi:hypothetical protein